MIKIVKNLIILVIAAVVVGVAAYYFFGSPKNDVSVSAGKITDVKTMAQLCTVEIFNEVPVKDTINNKMLFGIQKQQGSISFDMEKMEINADGDTIKITLAPEIIEINESTADNSWQVIDSKGLSIFTSNKLTDEEESAIKEKVKHNSIKLLYKNGTVERARAEGVNSITSLMEKVYRKPVTVIDPTPKGAYYNNYK